MFLYFSFLFWWLGDFDIASQAYPVLSVLSWFYLLTSLTPIPSAVMDSLNFPHIPSFFALLTTILDITLVFILTPRFHSLGPAYSTVISSIIGAPLFVLTSFIVFNRYQKKLLESK